VRRLGGDGFEVHGHVGIGVEAQRISGGEAWC
jgi:hypothetical protein